jgi:hypothetical protein
MRWTGLMVGYITSHHWSKEVKGDMQGCDTTDDLQKFCMEMKIVIFI